MIIEHTSKCVLEVDSVNTKIKVKKTFDQLKNGIFSNYL